MPDDTKRRSVSAEFDRLFGEDAKSFGKRLATQVFEGNEQFRSARENVERELSRGGRSAKGSFRL